MQSTLQSGSHNLAVFACYFLYTILSLPGLISKFFICQFFLAIFSFKVLIVWFHMAACIRQFPVSVIVFKSTFASFYFVIFYLVDLP